MIMENCFTMFSIFICRLYLVDQYMHEIINNVFFIDILIICILMYHYYRSWIYPLFFYFFFRKNNKQVYKTYYTILYMRK